MAILSWLSYLSVLATLVAIAAALVMFKRDLVMYVVWSVLSPLADVELSGYKQRLLQQMTLASVLPGARGAIATTIEPGAAPPASVSGVQEVGAASGEAVPLVSGVVVDLGAGFGSNIKYYAHNPGLQRVILVEPNTYMLDRLRRTARDAGLRDDQFEVVPARGEHLEFIRSGSVDCVVSTLVMCSVQDPRAVLAEVLRVLKPGGRFVYFEHVAADGKSAVEQHALTMQSALTRTGLWAPFTGDCHLDRPTGALIRAAGSAAGHRGSGATVSDSGTESGHCEWASVSDERFYDARAITAAVAPRIAGVAIKA
jgi:SAM-dependent methyltransferase